MKHIFIINPAAGSRDRTQEYAPMIRHACNTRDLDFEIAISKCPGNCTRIAREAAESGEEVRLYACGGDGTLNEVMAGAAGYPNAAITVFSSGSGNDFVKLFDDPKAFFELERLLDADETTFDLIDCNGDLSINICSVGLDARIGTDVSNYKRLPLLHGFRAYAASTVVNVIRGISEHYKVEVNGETLDGKFTFICVCNGRYYGGGFNPIPEANPADGKLDVLLVKHVSRAQVPFIIGKYKDGRYKELEKFARYLQTDSIKITCDGPTAINLDGELRTGTVAEFKVSDKKIRFFYPRGLTWKQEIPVLEC